MPKEEEHYPKDEPVNAPVEDMCTTFYVMLDTGGYVYDSYILR
jgi:hypothetical protein